MGSDLTDDERQALTRAGPRLCTVWGLSDDDTAHLISNVQDDQVQRVGVLIGPHDTMMVILGRFTRMALST